MHDKEALLRVLVARRRSEARDITSFELVFPDGRDMPEFSAGSHIDIQLPGGFVRQYSLSNHPGERHRYVIGVLRDPASRGGSRAMHELVQEGQELTIGAPRNNFPLSSAARRSLLIAAGIGVTPILSMARQLASQGSEFVMHYFARSKEQAAFIAEIEGSPFASQVAFHFDDGDASQKLDLGAMLDSIGGFIDLYVCGPKGFMDAVLNSAKDRGWPDELVHYEFFTPHTPVAEGDREFFVELASSGKTVKVEKNQTVIQALDAAGVSVETSCEQGICGTCLTRVLNGLPDHRDKYLTDSEHAANDCFLPCCSRSLSPVLVLDL